MRNIIAFVVVPFLFSSVYAADLNIYSTGFGDIKLDQIKNADIPLPIPVPGAEKQARCGHATGEITKLHLLAQSAKSMLYTYADTQELFDEFLDMWKPIITGYGLKPTTTEYTSRMGVLNYTSDSGLEVRDFWAEKLKYDALDPIAIQKLQHELLDGLEQAGMTPIASFNIKHEIFRPTFNIYYLTKPDENKDHEIRLRHLMKGEDIDYDIIENAGIRIVKKDTSYSMVYIGKEIGFVSKISATMEGINKRIEDYKKFLAEYDKELLGYRVHELDEPITIVDTTYKYLVNFYFYQ